MGRVCSGVVATRRAVCVPVVLVVWALGLGRSVCDVWQPLEGHATCHWLRSGGAGGGGGEREVSDASGEFCTEGTAEIHALSCAWDVWSGDWSRAGALTVLVTYLTRCYVTDM